MEKAKRKVGGEQEEKLLETRSGSSAQKCISRQLAKKKNSRFFPISVRFKLRA